MGVARSKDDPAVIQQQPFTATPSLLTFHRPPPTQPYSVIACPCYVPCYRRHRTSPQCARRLGRRRTHRGGGRESSCRSDGCGRTMRPRRRGTRPARGRLGRRTAPRARTPGQRRRRPTWGRRPRDLPPRAPPPAHPTRRCESARSGFTHVNDSSLFGGEILLCQAIAHVEAGSTRR